MQQYIELLQGYYKFLSLGKFFEVQAQTHLLSFPHQLPLATGDHTKFSINTELTSSLLTEIHNHPHSKNVFGYLVEISAFRGIFSVMREMIENLPRFRDTLKMIFADQYLPFEQTIRFLRNVLSHSSTPSLLIQQEDFQKQKEFLLAHKDIKGNTKPIVKKISLHFVYSAHLPEREGSPEYVCEATINFSTLKAGTSLRKVVSLHQMYMLSELCYNITKVVAQRVKRSPLPPTKSTSLKRSKKRKSLPRST
jgi:hypothetical protein